jgi:hypothetical protein
MAVERHGVKLLLVNHSPVLLKLRNEKVPSRPMLRRIGYSRSELDLPFSKVICGISIKNRHPDDSGRLFLFHFGFFAPAGNKEGCEYSNPRSPNHNVLVELMALKAQETQLFAIN